MIKNLIWAISELSHHQLCFELTKMATDSNPNVQQGFRKMTSFWLLPFNPLVHTAIICNFYHSFSAIKLGIFQHSQLSNLLCLLNFHIVMSTISEFPWLLWRMEGGGGSESPQAAFQSGRQKGGFLGVNAWSKILRLMTIKKVIEIFLGCRIIFFRKKIISDPRPVVLGTSR